MSVINNAIDVAAPFVKLANQSPENDLTNLKLQKILYLAQGHALGEHGKDNPLFRESVEAWPLGPVVREVYDTYSVLGASPITLLDIPDEVREVTEADSLFIENVWKRYGKYSASYLVDLTHKQKPWKSTFERGSRKVIPIEDMAAYFQPKS